MVSLTGYAPLSAWHVPLSFQGTMFKGCASGGSEEAAGEQASSHRTDMPSLPFRPLPISSHPTHCRLVEFPLSRRQVKMCEARPHHCHHHVIPAKDETPSRTIVAS